MEQEGPVWAVWVFFRGSRQGIEVQHMSHCLQAIAPSEEYAWCASRLGKPRQLRASPGVPARSILLEELLWIIHCKIDEVVKIHGVDVALLHFVGGVIIIRLGIGVVLIVNGGVIVLQGIVRALRVAVRVSLHSARGGAHKLRWQVTKVDRQRIVWVAGIGCLTGRVRFLPQQTSQPPLHCNFKLVPTFVKHQGRFADYQHISKFVL